MRLLTLLLAGVAVPGFAQVSPPGAPTVPARPTPATSQPAADPGRTPGQSYDATFFRQFQPSNALQMIQRLPGFSFDAGDQEVRGFGQAAGNVVIDGQRPAAKSDTLDTVLARIPASRVVSIEVAPGDRFGADYSTKPQVANVILAAGGGTSGTFEASVYRSFTGRLFPDGSASVVLKRGRSSFTLAANLSANAFPEEGFDRLTSPSGALIEFRDKFNDTRDPNASVSANWAYDGGANRTAHVNGRYGIDRFRLTQYNDVFPATGPVRDDRLFERYHLNEYEIGGDVTRPLLGGGLKALALVTRRTRDNSDRSLNRIASTVIGGAVQTLDDRREETLGRLVWSRSNWGGWNVELGGESALNRLVSNVDLASLDASGGLTPIDLPIDNATVKEFRSEAFVNAGRAIAPKLRMDLGLTYEASHLTVRGDATASRTLKFLKPKASFDWQLPFVHAQVSVTRTVAQLQFEDFISAAELTTNRVNGGNAELLPQRAWEVLATLQRPFLGDGLLKLELGYNRVSLVQDRVPTEDGFDAPGNLGNGSVRIVRGTLDAPLTKLGIKGGRFTLYGSYVDTSVRDPYTDERRRFSGNATFYWQADFRQDLGRFAWGWHLEAATTSTNFRLDELDNQRGSRPFATAFAEYRPDKATSVTLGVRNALDLPAFRLRTFYAPNRTSPDPSAFEKRQRNQHVVPYLTVKRSFG